MPGGLQPVGHLVVLRNTCWSPRGIIAHVEILGLSTAELTTLAQQLGSPAYRGKQISEWLYRRNAGDFEQMTNLPAELKQKLASGLSLVRAQIVQESNALDGTTKYLLRFADGETVESVLLPYQDRVSVCVSTQIGCPAGCVFCATADCGFARNLSAGEIVDQVLTLQAAGGQRVTHVVFMGMGEPLLNTDNVLKAIRLLHDEIGISMRRMTISTVGITPAIRELAAMDLQLTLAVSLHAPDQELRRKLIPLSNKYPIGGLIEACRDYANLTKRRVTFEYMLLADINDSPSQAASLGRLLKGSLCHVNLIPYNEVTGKSFRRPTRDAIQAFRQALEAAGIEVTQRFERGHAVSAACGQLRRRQTAGN